MFNLNRKHLISAALVVAIFIGSFVASVQQSTLAISRGSSDQVIALAASSPIFKNVLDARPGWTAAAYDSGNSYGIWRVQFWDTEGEDIGWADVSLTKGRIYAWESNTGATDDQKNIVRDSLLDFLAAQDDIRELVGNPRDYDTWLDYNGWINTWFVYIGKGGLDSIYVGIHNNSDDLLNVEHLTLGGIYFPEVESYTDWEAGQKSQAVALAFANADIAAAVRDHDGWITDTTRAGDSTWTVTFKANDQILASATVDIAAKTVTDIHLNGS